MDDAVDDTTPVIVPDVIRRSVRREAAMELSTEKMLDRAALLAIGNGQTVEEFIEAARQSFNLNLIDVVQRARAKENEWREARAKILSGKDKPEEPAS